MPLTSFQRDVCRLLAAHRLASGEAYVAGGAALNLVLGAARVSRDLDLFHDTEEALVATWEADRRLLGERGLALTVLRERPAFVEAEVRRGGEVAILQWVRDSAYRFFPLVKHEDLGLTMHPLDLATNKVLALVGRHEVRDWVDAIECDRRVQPLGYLAWAASGKDPGFGPAAIIEEAARTGRFAAEEVRALAFAGTPPDPADLSRRFRAAIAAARDVVEVLPAAEAGSCVLTEDGQLYRGEPAALPEALAHRSLRFHRGRIRGAFPEIVDRR